MPRITALSVRDIRFPTSRQLDGSDAMNPDPDYSAAYVVIHTDATIQQPRTQAQEPLEGHGLSFTIGRGNDIICAAIRAHEHLLIGKSLEEFAENPGAFWRHLNGDSQLRWIGPDKGAIHLAMAALVNALWDLYAKSLGKPLWRVLVDFTPEELIRCIDFRYITDALDRPEALDLLQRLEPSKSQRIATVEAQGYPAYTTSAGWLGYDDDRLRKLCREAVAQGWTNLKIKVGRDLPDDIRRCTIIREEIGMDRHLMTDANQVWDVPQAIEWMKQLARFKPLWIEEPTSPDDILGHATIARALEPYGIGVATGEHGMNRVLFKQLLQAKAIRFCQIDSCRLGGVNEVLAVLLLAAKFGVPVCPHAGGVGLCEHVQHLSLFDYVAVTGSMEHRVIEYVDHLHEHFVDPVRMKRDAYIPPTLPGYSTTMKPQSLADHEFPNGRIWKTT